MFNDIWTDTLLVGVISATVAFIMGLIDFVVKKKSEKREEGNLFSQGLRSDIDRKNKEIEELKDDMLHLNIVLNNYRTAYWALFESFSMLRTIVRNALNDSGWTNERIDEVIPPLPERPSDMGGG